MKYTEREISSSLREKMMSAYYTSLEISRRNLLCPHCGYKICYVYSDTEGHIGCKCNKCKSVVVFKFKKHQNTDFRIPGFKNIIATC
ncbi:MAG: hypothetical protein K6F14_06210 [Clostridiales bacterium]|nr:hypothetical protein [Clostridiales bacterium]